MRRPLAWSAVVLVNLSAMTIFLWHQTALMAVTATTLPSGHLLGLHTHPDSLTWVAARVAWLPVFALALTICWTAFRTYEQDLRPRPRLNRIRIRIRAKNLHRA
jgi:hypothetical protein